MKSKIQFIKEGFIKKNELDIIKNYLNNDENEKVLKKYNLSDDDEAEVLKQYKKETDMSGKIRFYTEQSQGQITDDELQQYINFKMIHRLDNMESTLYTIKNILVFWLILTIIGLIGLIYIWFKLKTIF